ncbi:MAG: hypothetical protein OXC82_05225 [Rhodobacteraceae bacterium]|nr:hypothetical protein [Paracoccaceae bacterium]MCY4249824.1 hypothetical protein [Paracoccaceae bacterium]
MQFPAAQHVHHPRHEVTEEDRAVPQTANPATKTSQDFGFLQGTALLVVFRQVAISHAGEPRSHQKGNGLFVMYGES